MPHWRRRKRGFSLIEVLIVVALVGITAAIGFGYISGIFRRQRVSMTAADLKTLMQGVRSTGQNRNALAYLRLAPPDAAGAIPLQIFVDTNGNSQLDIPGDLLAQEYLIRDEFTVASPDPDGAGPAGAWDQWFVRATNDYAIGCDFLGRTVNPGSQLQVVRPVRLELTRDDMVSGQLTPQVTWTLSVNPVWNVTLAQRLGP